MEQIARSSITCSLVRPAVIYQENSLFYGAFALLCFTDTQILCFWKTERLWRSWIKQVYWSRFCNSICSLCVCLCHILVILKAFQSFKLLLYLFYICLYLCSVIFSVVTVIVSGCHEPHLCETVYLIDRCCVFWLLYWWAIPHLSTSPQTTLLPKTQHYWH